MTTGMATPRVSLPRELPHQIPILMDPHRFKLLVCGRRWGKTATGLLATVQGHGSYRGQFRGAVDGGRIWWVAPSYPTIEASRIWHDLKKACRGLPRSEMDRRIDFPGGGFVSVRSASDPDSLRGPGLDGVVVDEAAFVSVDAWQNSLRPALSDRNGWAMLATTPNGYNWIYDLFEDVPQREHWQRWQRPTADNPLVSADELEDLKRQIGPRSFAQEHEAQFMSIAGAMWPAEYFQTIYAETWPDAFEIGVVAVDPSLGQTETADYSSICFLGVSGGKLWCDADIQRRTPSEIIADVWRMNDRYTPHCVAIESNGFQNVLRPLSDAYCQINGRPPLPIVPINNTAKEGSKSQRISRLDPYLANGSLKIRRHDSGRLLVEQMMMFPLKGHHDDGPDSLEMAIRMLSRACVSGNNDVDETIYAEI